MSSPAPETSPKPIVPADLEIKDAQLIFNHVWKQLEADYGRANLRFPKELILLGGAPRSMSSLCALLSDRFAMTFHGEQFIGGWQRLEDDELTALGQGHSAPELGRTAFLGRRVWDQAAAIRLQAEDQPMERVMDLLPGGELHDDFKAAVRGFIPSALRVEVMLTPAADALKFGSVGALGRLSSGSAPRLGWNAWMGDGLTGQSRMPSDVLPLTTPNRQPDSAAPAPMPARFSFECAGHEH